MQLQDSAPLNAPGQTAGKPKSERTEGKSSPLRKWAQLKLPTHHPLKTPCLRIQLEVRLYTPRRARLGSRECPFHASASCRSFLSGRLPAYTMVDRSMWIYSPALNDPTSSAHPLPRSGSSICSRSFFVLSRKNSALLSEAGLQSPDINLSQIHPAAYRLCRCNSRSLSQSDAMRYIVEEIVGNLI